MKISEGVKILILLILIATISASKSIKIANARIKAQNKESEAQSEVMLKRILSARVSPPTIVPEPEPPPRAVFASCEQYRPLVARYAWNVEVAMAVMKAESGCRPDVVSRTNDHGLFQLHGIPIHDPEENIKYAYYNKYLKGGWGHWVVCTTGKVKCW